MGPMGWDDWKKRFDAWEDRTARQIETGLRSSAFIAPASAVLTRALRAKVKLDRLQTALVGALGLPTKADQERTLHALHRLESRLMDLEEKLEQNSAGSAADVAENTRDGECAERKS